MTTSSYRARWVIPVSSPPIANGIVVVHGERVVGVHRTKRPDTVDLGDVAILPGLVNCHTHLEFSRIAEPLQPMTPFTEWIRQVVAYRQSRGEESRRTTDEQPSVDPHGRGANPHSTSETAASSPIPLPKGETGVGEAIRRGLDESLRAGVTLLGDIATTGWTWDDYRHGPDCVVFQELLGLSEARVAEQMALADTHLQQASAAQVAGLSPHAPYSVHPKLFQHAVHRAQSAAAPLAIHLAETAAERELLAHGTGEFRSLLEGFGIWRPDLFGGRSWREYLDPLSELPQALVIHGNHLSDDDLRFLAMSPHLTLVYCPRTHAAFGHPRHPWQTLLNLGGSVALGTDSRASNPDLSLWAELQYLAANFSQMSHLELLRMATRDGARALGQSRDHGGLDAGKLANLIVVGPVPDDGPALHQELMTPASTIRGVMFRGHWIVTP